MRSVGWAIARFVLFWTAFAAVSILSFQAIGHILPQISIDQIQSSWRAAPDWFGLSTSKIFAFNLAGLIGAAAIGLSVAYGIVTISICLLLEAYKRQIRVYDSAESFAENLSRLEGQIGRTWLVGHAFREFYKTTFIEKEPLRVKSTTRPQAFITLNTIRDRSTSLQIMPSAAGYFVGLGLLLTFIGLIAALSVAAPSVSAGNADDAKIALNQLLDAATFKFATSIAGLGGSLILSLLVRLYGLSIERGIARFCEAIEQHMQFVSGQQISFEIWRTLKSQLNHLQNIDSDNYFQRFSAKVVPQIQTAMGKAIEPLTERIITSTAEIRDQSSGGVKEMVEQFSRTLSGTAGREVTALAETLAGLKEALERTQNGLRGSGEDFSRRLIEAVTTMSARLGQATEKLEAAAGRNSRQLEESMGRLTEAFAEAGRKALADLSGAASAAGGTMKGAVESVAGDMRTSVLALNEALAATQTTLQQQSAATIKITQNAASTADAFELVAQNVREASAPLTTSATKIAESTATMADAVTKASTALFAGQSASQALAAELKAQVERARDFWASYEERFKNVDQQLGDAIKTFGEQLVSQQNLVRDYTKSIDDGFTKAVRDLNGAITNLGEQATGIEDAVTEFVTKVSFPVGQGNSHHLGSNGHGSP